MNKERERKVEKYLGMIEDSYSGIMFEAIRRCQDQYYSLDVLSSNSIELNYGVILCSFTI